jgi:predicted DsbA family dithiol-disulfide isomerase
MNTITIWADIGCPWSYVACLRLHRMRDHLEVPDVAFEFRARPLELSDEGPQTPSEVKAAVIALAQVEHTAFTAYKGERFPTTLLPASEAQKWGYSMGQEVGEGFDLALRRAMFLHSHDLSQRTHLLEVAGREGLDAASLAKSLDGGLFRAAVMEDHEASRSLATEGTPVVVLPDGTEHGNPGMTVEWIRGIPVITADHHSVYDDILRTAEISD